MKTITIAFPNMPEGVSDNDLRLYMRDAIYEAYRAREPADRYVAKRYATMPVEFRERKLVEIERKLKVYANATVCGPLDADVSLKTLDTFLWAFSKVHPIPILTENTENIESVRALVDELRSALEEEKTLGER